MHKLTAALRACASSSAVDPLALGKQSMSRALQQSASARVDALQQSSEVYSPIRGKVDPRACEVATNKYGGFWGPFAD